MITTKTLIAKCGKTKAQLAALACVSRAAMTRYAQGREPEVVIASRLAKATGTEAKIVDGQIVYVKVGK